MGDEPRPPTVSEVCWIGQSTGTCPDCGRADVEIGFVNVNYPGAERLLCIRCHFGPPPDLLYGDPEDDEEDDWIEDD